MKVLLLLLLLLVVVVVGCVNNGVAVGTSVRYLMAPSHSLVEAK